MDMAILPVTVYHLPHFQSFLPLVVAPVLCYPLKRLERRRQDRLVT